MASLADDLKSFALPEPSAKPSASATPLPDAKTLAASLAQISMANQNPDVRDLMTVSDQRGNGLTADNVLLQDWHSLDPVQFQAKYGADTYDKLAAFQVGGQNVRQMQSTERSPGEFIGDSANSIGSAFAQGGMGMAALALSPFSKKNAVQIAQGMKRLQEFSNSQQSDTLNEHRYVDSLKSALDNQDNNAQYDKDNARNRGFIASLQSYGRGFINGTKRLVDDPMMLSEGIANGVGSMLLAGPTSRTLTGVAETLGPKVLKAGEGAYVAGSPAAQAASRAIEQAAFPTSVALQEAGGSYTQTAQDVMGKSDTELRQTSPEYVDMRDRQGLSETDAKSILAGRAGNIAAAITAPIAAATGKLVEPIEKAPFERIFKQPGHALADMAKEGVEETIQSGTGQFSQNVGEALHVDPNQNLMDGVGDQSAQGGIFGALSAGVTHSPGVAKNLAQSATMKVLKAAGDVAANRADAVRTERELNNRLSETTIRDAVQEQSQALPDVEQSVQTLATEAAQAAPTPEAKQKVQDDAQTTIAQMRQANTITADDVGSVPAHLAQQHLTDDNNQPLSRTDAMINMAKLARDETAPKADRTEAAKYLMRSLAQFEDGHKNVTPDFLQSIPHDRPEMEAIQKFQAVMNAVNNSPSIVQAMNWAKGNIEINPEDVKTPNQTQAETVAAQARLAPETLNPTTGDVILQQAKDGHITLTPQQQTLIRSAQALSRSGIEGAQIINSGSKDNKNDNTLKNGTDFVNNQVLVQGGKAPSLKEHFDNVMKGVLTGNMDAAKRSAKLLHAFAQSHANKVAALNQSIELGDRTKVSFDGSDPQGRKIPAKRNKPVFVAVGNESSERNARQIYAEAHALGKLANTFAKLYPEFGLNEIKTPVLNLPGINETNSSVNSSQNQRGDATTAASNTSQATTSGSDEAQSASPRADSQAQVKPQEQSSTATETPSPNQEQGASTENHNKPNEANVGADQHAGKVGAVSPETEQTRAKGADQSPGETADKVKTGKVDDKGIFQPTSEWQVVPDHAILPPGLEIQVNMQTGEKLARDPKAKPETQTNTTQSTEIPHERMLEILAHNLLAVSRDYLNRANAQLGKLSNLALAKLIEEANPGLTLSLIDGEAKKIINNTLENLKLRGLVRMILATEYADGKGPKQGRFFKGGPFIGLSAQLIQDINEGRKPKEVLEHALVHELAHALDFHAATNGQNMASDNQFTIGDPLWQELQNVKGKLSAISYEPLWNYLENAAPTVQSSELFAELAQVVLNDPARAKELIPNGVKAVEAILQRAGQNAGLGNLTINDPGPAVAADPSGPELQAQAEAVNTQEAYPNLIVHSGENWFQKVFPKFGKVRTRIMSSATPVTTFLDKLAQPSQLVKEAKVPLSQKNVAAYEDLMALGQKILDHMNTQLNSDHNGLLRAFTEPGKDGKPQEPLRFRRGKALNIAEKTDTGYRYNQQLIETALMAGLDWLINGQGQEPFNSADDIADFLKIDRQAVTPDMVSFFNRGVMTSQAVNTVADKIIQFWGLKPSRNADQAYVKGIAQAVAGEILAGMQSQKLLENVEGKQFWHITGRSYRRVLFDVQSAKTQQMFRDMAGAKNLIPKMALENAPRLGASIGEKILDVAKTQLRNAGVNTTTQNRQAMENAQDTPHYLNLMVHDFMMAMDYKSFARLMGGDPDYAKRPYNKNDLESVKGKTEGLYDSYRNIQDHAQAVKAYADAHNIAVEDVPTYFERQITRVGRVQMVGPANGQGDKLAREILMPTKTTLDLTKPSELAKFWLTVAQGLGEKTEKATRVENVAKAQALVAENGQYGEVIKELRYWLNKREQGTTLAVPKSIITLIRDSSGEKQISMHGIHSLLAVANYENAKEAGKDLSSFTHYNYLEADGKTNGPIMGMMLLGVGPFTAEFVRNVAKGGIFFGNHGEKGKTLNSHYVDDNKDLYKESADRTSIALADHLRRLRASSPDVAEHMDRLLRLMQALNTDIRLDEKGALTIDRGVTKNPLTISIYGSGQSGIAGKVAGELVEMIYAKASKFLQENPERFSDLTYKGFMDDLYALTSQGTEFKKETYSLGKKFVTQRSDDEKTAEKFTLNRYEFKRFQDNVQHLFVTPMSTAIDATVMGHVSTATKALQEATQIQSIVMRGLFKKAIVEKLLDKMRDPDFRQGDFLSEAEIQEIYKQLHGYGPQFGTGTQNYFIGGSEQSNLLGQKDDDGNTIEIKVAWGNQEEKKVSLPGSFGSDQTEDFKSKSTVYAPSLAGVSAIPTMVIGSGDGQTVLNILTDPRIKGILDVYDGINMPADKIDEYSRYVNEAVHRALTEGKHPMRALEEAFRTFVKKGPFQELLDTKSAIGKALGLREEAIKEMTKVIYNRGKPEPDQIATVRNNPEMINGYVGTLLGRLVSIADEAEARAEVYRQFPMSVDQMASGENPYVHVGSVQMEQSASNDAVLDAMNRVYWKAMEGKGYTNQYEVARKAQAKKDAVEGPNPVFQAQVESFGQQDGDSGAWVTTHTSLSHVFKNLRDGMSELHREMFDNALDVLKGQRYRIVFGNTEQVDTWLQANNADRYQPGLASSSYGFVDPVAKVIVITNTATETMVHELVHTATFEKIARYYDAEKNGHTQHGLSDIEVKAIQNLKVLMQQWMGEDHSLDGELAHTAYKMAWNEVRKWTERGNPAAALNEFMAWTLANQNLSQAADRITVSEKSKRQIGGILGIAADALKAIKQILWGARKDTEVTIDDSLLSQIRFNTKILMATPSQIDHLKNDYLEVLQHRRLGTDDRLNDIQDKVHDKIIAYLDDVQGLFRDYTQLERWRQVRKNKLNGSTLAKEYAAHFNFNTLQQKLTFSSLYSVLAADLDINPNAVAKINEVYQQVINNLKFEDFRTNNDPHDYADINKAQDRYAAILGQKLSVNDAKGRSSLMPAFLALAMVDDQFRDVLSKMQVEKDAKDKSGTWDAALNNLGSAAMDRMSDVLSGAKLNQSREVTAVLDNLVDSMLEYTADGRSWIENTTGGVIDGTDRRLSNAIQRGSEQLVQTAQRLKRTSPSKTMRGLARVLEVGASLVNEKRADQVSEGVLAYFNNRNGLVSMREAISDMIGRTTENAGLFDLISKVRAAVQQLRQQYREELPKTILGKFERTLTAQELSAMHMALGKSDLAAAHSTYGLDNSLRLVHDARYLQREIRTQEQALRALDPARFGRMQTKAKQLAAYMMTGKHGVNLLRNAHAVAHLFGESGRKRSGQVSQDVINQVDTLTTLYALTHLSQEQRDLVKDLVQSEGEGSKYVLSQLLGLRKDEHSKINGEMGLVNHYKGYIPANQQQGVSLIIADDHEQTRLENMGYTRVADYTGSSADRSLGSKGYYFTPVSGRATYNQGVLQTVHQTVNGVDPNTGYTVHEITAGRIVNPVSLQSIQQQMAYARATQENLLPVYNKNGQVVAYERGVNVDETHRLNRDTNVATMIGAWAGRQIEEELGQQSNQVLIDNLKAIWDKGVQDGRQGGYVDLANLGSNADPVLREAWKMIPDATKRQIHDTFGNQFMVRRDMLNDAVGYRSASIGDVFTGQSRWSPPVRKAMEDVALAIFGHNAYRKLVSKEQNLQDLVMTAKQLIVVKSVVVPVGNMLGNMMQLAYRGVPVRHILKGVPKKTAEINTYIKARHQYLQLEADLMAAKGANDLRKQTALEARMTAIEDTYKHLSIWPLIEAGEFSTISSGAPTAEDVAIANGRWGSLVDRAVAMAPEGLPRNLVRYGMVTNDTALYQGLAKAVQYGDFIARAILYDDMTKRQKLTKSDALTKLSEEFVNYNKLAGRSRQYLESVGLMWFWNYKMRTLKVATSMLRNQPLRSLMGITLQPHMPLISNIGTPLRDNFLTELFDGRLGYPIGPGVGMHAISMNPWLQLIH